MPLTTVQPGMLGTPQPYNFKNRIINGAMVIDQRNAGASITPSQTGSIYTVDRFYYATSVASKFSIQQNAASVTPPVGFSNYLGFTSQSAYSSGSTDQFGLRQAIEGLNVADLGWGTANAKPITLSFWARSSLTGTFSGSIYNSAANRSYVFSYTINAANTWEYETITIAGDTTGTWLTTNGVGVVVQWNLGNGSTYLGTAGSWGSTYYAGATSSVSVVGTNGATFYITGVQLEVGVTATGFDYRPYGTELALCQRYCPAWSLSGSYTSLAGGLSPGATGIYALLPYPVTPRVPATGITSTGTYVGITASYGVGGTGTLAISPYGNSNNLGLLLSGSSGLTTGAASFIACVATGTVIATGCEL